MARSGGSSAGPPSRSPIELTVDQKKLAELANFFRNEADGKELKKQFTRELRQAVAPLVVQLKNEIKAMPSQNLPHAEGGSLRQEIAKRIAPKVSLGQKNPGIKVRARTTPNVRGFTYAGRRMNREGFRHPLFGSWESPQVQVGEPRWFDDTTFAYRPEIRRAVLAAMDAAASQMAARLGSRR